MPAHFRIVTSLCLMIASSSLVQADTSKMLFTFDESFDVDQVQTHNANVDLTGAGKSQALDVTFGNEADTAYLAMVSPGWDLSNRMGVAMDITNHGKSSIDLLARVSVDNQRSSLESFVSVKPGQTETLQIVFLRGELPDYIDHYLTNMRGLPGGYLLHWVTPDLTRLNKLLIFKAPSDETMHFSVDKIRATGDYRLPTEQELKGDFFPFVDQFGQYQHAQWPGKAASQSDINQQHVDEISNLQANPAPRQWNAYGGWAAGPQLKATGHFRTQQLDGKWWLVDPTGRLFWSQGITGVKLSQSTNPKGRENYFTKILEGGDFRRANLKRKFGDDWVAKTAQLSHARLHSWGVNTVANWSDREIYSLQKTPYVVYLGSGISKEVPAELNENAFREKVRRRINPESAARFKDDPWCLGVFVDNELHWPRENASDVAETYYKVVSEVFKNAAPKILYLGSRIHGGPKPVYTAAAKYCDVVSINRYQFIVAREDLPEGSEDKPLIIGEFHFGALDRGLLHTGLRSVGNQQQRANAYTFYLRQALKNDRIVGAHWFQYSDQVVTGRGDGENYQIGFVDIVDRPYPEMVEAARRLSKYLYSYRSGAIAQP